MEVRHRYTVLVAATRGLGNGVWRVFAVRNSQSEADDVVRDQKWIDSRPPKQTYSYQIVKEKMANHIFADADFTRLDPAQAAEFCSQSQRHEMHDPIFGGSVVVWRHPDGRMYVESISVRAESLDG